MQFNAQNTQWISNKSHTTAKTNVMEMHWHIDIWFIHHMLEMETIQWNLVFEKKPFHQLGVVKNLKIEWSMHIERHIHRHTGTMTCMEFNFYNKLIKAHIMGNSIEIYMVYFASTYQSMHTHSAGAVIKYCTTIHKIVLINYILWSTESLIVLTFFCPLFK